MNNRCLTCGRKWPCEPCEARARQAREDAFLDALAAAPRGPLLVWFRMPLDVARQHMNRLQAEWGGVIDVYEPDEPEDRLGCLIARTREELKLNHAAEYDVSLTRIERIDPATDPFYKALQRMIERERS